MKVMLAYYDPNDFYRIVIDNDTLCCVYEAKSWLNSCPYNGQLEISTPIYNITHQRNEECFIIIRKTHTDVALDFETSLLEYGDDLLKLPDLYLTRSFRVMSENAKKYLSKDDIELVEAWNKTQL